MGQLLGHRARGGGWDRDLKGQVEDVVNICLHRGRARHWAPLGPATGSFAFCHQHSPPPPAQAPRLLAGALHELWLLQLNGTGTPPSKGLEGGRRKRDRNQKSPKDAGFLFRM